MAARAAFLQNLDEHQRKPSPTTFTFQLSRTHSDLLSEQWHAYVGTYGLSGSRAQTQLDYVLALLQHLDLKNDERERRERESERRAEKERLQQQAKELEQELLQAQREQEIEQAELEEEQRRLREQRERVEEEQEDVDELEQRIRKIRVEVLKKAEESQKLEEQEELDKIAVRDEDERLKKENERVLDFLGQLVQKRISLMTMKSVATVARMKTEIIQIERRIAAIEIDMRRKYLEKEALFDDVRNQNYEDLMTNIEVYRQAHWKIESLPEYAAQVFDVGKLREIPQNEKVSYAQQAARGLCELGFQPYAGYIESHGSPSGTEEGNILQMKRGKSFVAQQRLNALQNVKAFSSYVRLFSVTKENSGSCLRQVVYAIWKELDMVSREPKNRGTSISTVWTDVMQNRLLVVDKNELAKRLDKFTFLDELYYGLTHSRYTLLSDVKIVKWIRLGMLKGCRQGMALAARTYTMPVRLSKLYSFVSSTNKTMLNDANAHRFSNTLITSSVGMPLTNSNFPFHLFGNDGDLQLVEEYCHETLKVMREFDDLCSILHHFQPAALRGAAIPMNNTDAMELARMMLRLISLSMMVDVLSSKMVNLMSPANLFKPGVIRLIPAVPLFTLSVLAHPSLFPTWKWTYEGVAGPLFGRNLGSQRELAEATIGAVLMAGFATDNALAWLLAGPVEVTDQGNEVQTEVKQFVGYDTYDKLEQLQLDLLQTIVYHFRRGSNNVKELAYKRWPNWERHLPWNEVAMMTVDMKLPARSSSHPYEEFFEQPGFFTDLNRRRGSALEKLYHWMQPQENRPDHYWDHQLDWTGSANARDTKYIFNHPEYVMKRLFELFDSTSNRYQIPGYRIEMKFPNFVRLDKRKLPNAGWVMSLDVESYVRQFEQKTAYPVVSISDMVNEIGLAIDLEQQPDKPFSQFNQNPVPPMQALVMHLNLGRMDYFDHPRHGRYLIDFNDTLFIDALQRDGVHVFQSYGAVLWNHEFSCYVAACREPHGIYDNERTWLMQAFAAKKPMSGTPESKININIDPSLGSAPTCFMETYAPDPTKPDVLAPRWTVVLVFYKRVVLYKN